MLLNFKNISLNFLSRRTNLAWILRLLINLHTMVRAIQKDGLNVGANSLIDQYYFIISSLYSKIDLTLNENEIHVNIHMVLLGTD